ncbi:hypothetical protein CCP3SC1AL1_770016 [Gammaproteobacteria bacterium]
MGQLFSYDLSGDPRGAAAAATGDCDGAAVCGAVCNEGTERPDAERDGERGAGIEVHIRAAGMGWGGDDRVQV